MDCDQTNARLGRPKLARIVANVSLPPRCVELLRSAGDGNLSMGIVRAADALELLSRAGVDLSASRAAQPPVVA